MIRNFMIDCVGFVAMELFMWLVRLVDAYEKENYPLIVFCLAVPGFHFMWIGGITLVMFGILPALIAAPLAGLGGLAVVNSTSKQGQMYLENLAKNPR